MYRSKENMNLREQSLETWLNRCPYFLIAFIFVAFTFSVPICKNMQVPVFINKGKT